jgi:hypothetical protein
MNLYVRRVIGRVDVKGEEDWQARPWMKGQGQEKRYV